jgi:hypothetical protein
MLNTFATAGLRVDRAIEPELAPEDRKSYPHKQAWLNEHLGVILFCSVLARQSAAAAAAAAAANGRRSRSRERTHV